MAKQNPLQEIGVQQEAQIPDFCEKWRSVQLLTHPIDRDKVAEIIKASYQISGYSEPEIVFYCSPFEAIKAVSCIQNPRDYLGRDIRIKFVKRVFDHLLHLIERQLEKRLFTRFRNQTLFSSVPYDPKACNSLPFYFPDIVMEHLRCQLTDDLKKLTQP